MEIDGRTELYGVLGHPLSHTLSPAIHNAFLREAERNGVYLPLAVARGGLGAALEGLRVLPFRGLSVTSPFKEEILPLVDELVGMASQTRSVNTVFKEGRLWKGFDTDGQGLCDFLQGALGEDLASHRVTLLGAGSAARSGALALSSRGVASLTVLNRTAGRFEHPCFRRLSERAEVKLTLADGDEAREALSRTTLLVNASAYGLGGRSEETPPPWPLDQLEEGVLAVDMNYSGRGSTPLLTHLGPRVRGHDGRGMLVYQAAEAFRIWTDEKPDVACALAAVGLEGITDRGSRISG